MPDHFKAKNLSSRFITKDKTKTKNQNDLVYLCNCPETNCTDNYIGETARRIQQGFINQNSRGKTFPFFNHVNEHRHTCAVRNEFKKQNKGFRNSTTENKILEPLFNKELRSI